MKMGRFEQMGLDKEFGEEVVFTRECEESERIRQLAQYSKAMSLGVSDPQPQVQDDVFEDLQNQLLVVRPLDDRQECREKC
jgi:hypothetical protein